jgi:hypothetical protein
MICSRRHDRMTDHLEMEIPFPHAHMSPVN